MKSFEYAAPKSVKEATGLLGEKWGEVEILAGGTDLLTCLKQQITTPSRVVSLKHISNLRGINSGKDGLRIGAMTALSELIRNADVQKHFPALATAAKNIASPQMLAMGTVGGELCQRPRCWYYRNGFGLLGMQEGASLIREGDNRYHAIFATSGPALFVSASSLGPVLVALGATLTAEGPKAKARQIAASEFFRAPHSERERETALEPNEVLTEISIPMKGLRNATYEVRHRHGLDWPYVTATVAFSDKNGTASDSRVVLGHVAPTPWSAMAADQALNGAQIDDAAAAKCADAAVQGAKPLSKNAYKVQLVKAAVKRAILATRTA
jgi:xanthine dehydrogenase YagS FAD-binding subunit